MTTQQIRMVGVVLALLVLTGAAGVGAVLWKIDQSAAAIAAEAQLAYPHPGDDVAALLDVMGDADLVLRERNRAVWALGRLRAEQALPALLSVYTGEPCDHETGLCQYELSKAIARCGGDVTAAPNNH